MTIVNVKDLQNGDILAEDVYRGKTLMLKKGSILSKLFISKLRQWDITSVEINNENGNNPVSEKVINNNNIPLKFPPDKSELERDFLNNLSYVAYEYRYGIALHELTDYQWLENLFIKLMSDTTTCELMEKLGNWDFYSYKHSFDVFILGSLLAKKLEIDNIENFATGCLLHDIGKLIVPKSVLNKPSRLNLEEYNLIKNHTVFGYDLLKQHNFSEDAAILAKYHHERVNGSGYPDGLKNTEITDIVKILSIVDVYSALTLDRPYREAYGSATAEKILINECKMVGNYYFYNFFKMLDIFPLDTLVELTNGTHAKIIDIDDKLPTFPILEGTNDSNQFKKYEIPLDRSIKVKNVIEF
ncbi:HD-GYP domain-containing protein [Virgibacillus ndiopensis]|uniref:HD-GYP domain-containing protein n=1 Tax=Virgibacillus ndiopensis TaxID=2004408 RepID=UPI000C082C42|nr:HD domain-containing phosphohydrolase [Virgibacillus ndiopensis]